MSANASALPFKGRERVVGYALFALASPHGWVALAMPVLMLHFLINVTGVKPTEEQALKSRGDVYRAYQATTPPVKAAESGGTGFMYPARFGAWREVMYPW